MNAYRIHMAGVGLLAALCMSCDSPDPTEPVPPTELAVNLGAVNLGVKVNAPSNPDALAVSHSQIDVSWQDNSSNETGFEVHRSSTGTNGPFTELAVTESGTVGYSDGAGNPSTAYCYQVRAFRTTGHKKSYSAFSSAACATTKPPPLPAAPSGVSATPEFSGFRIRITWIDNATNETGFRVERSATSAGAWTSIGNTGPGVTSFQYSQVPEGDQPACYRVFALNSFGPSEPSNVDCATVPIAPTDLIATALADGSVNLTWADISAVEDGYEVQRASEGAGGMSVIATLPANTTAYRDAGVADGAYGYAVRATKDGGTSAGSNFVQVVVATRPPNAPTNVDAAPAASTVVTVTWVDLAINEEGSRVERSTDGGTSWVAAGTLGWYLLSPWFSDEARSAEQQVCYRVITFNPMGDSPPSNMDCTTPPAGPTGFTATAVGSDAVDFAWTDNSAFEDGYQILIDYGYGYWEAIAGVGANTTSFRLEGDPYAQYQTYYAVATKDGGFSDWSNPASATTPAE